MQLLGASRCFVVPQLYSIPCRRVRVLQSKAWAEYLRLPPIPPYDETAGLAEIEQRNALRAETNLPLMDARREITRVRQAYESERFSERFYDVSFRCITEIYGAIEPCDFNSMSGMAAFFASRRNLIHALIQKQGGSGRRREESRGYDPV